MNRMDALKLLLVMTMLMKGMCVNYYDHMYVYDEDDTFNPSEIPADATMVVYKNINIGTIPSGAFSHLSNCLKIAFENTALTTFEQDAWQGLEKVYEFWLQKNGPTSLQSDMFKHLNSLKTLIFENNTINEIDAGTWNFVNTSLTRLVFNTNKLPTLTENTFMYLGSLEELKFSETQIAEIVPGTFNGLSSLKSLELYDTMMEPDALTGLENLNVLKWENSGLTVVNKELLKHVPNLLKLLLAKNKITEVEPDAWMGQDKLKWIDLQNNELTIIKSEMFNHFPSLLTLFLAKNQISEIEPDAWLGLDHEIFDVGLDDNLITTLYTDIFKHLSGLIALSLENNKISSIQPGALNGMKGLMRIYLSGNEITSLDTGYWNGLTLRFSKLTLNDNNISEVKSGTFNKLTRLSNLELHNNQLETLEWNAFGWEKFGTLLHPYSLSLSISGNPLTCDEKMQWMKVALEEGWLKWETYSVAGQPTCDNVPGTPFKDVNLVQNAVTCYDSGYNYCRGHGDCVNNNGEYSCDCHQGYAGSNMICDDVDECKNGTHKCSSVDKCFNTEGSYICTDASKGHAISGTKFTLCIIIMCNFVRNVFA